MKFTLMFAVLLVVVASTSLADAKGCFCTDDYDPVCSTDGLTYGNKCNLDCANKKLAHRGQCREASMHHTEK